MGARSHLERLMLKLVRGARLPEPEVNVPVGDITPDLTWPAVRLAVEADGSRRHCTRDAKRRDHRRDRYLTTLGWRPIRFTYEEVVFEPAVVARDLAGFLG